MVLRRSLTLLAVLVWTFALTLVLRPPTADSTPDVARRYYDFEVVGQLGGWTFDLTVDSDHTMR